MNSILRTLVVVFLLAAQPAAARIAGGGDPARDCWMEFEAPGRTLNFPRAPRLGREVRCFDGEAGCDLDGAVDGKCTFDVDVCFHADDPSLPGCQPVGVTSAVVKRRNGDPGLSGLQDAIDALMPVDSLACTEGQTFEVHLRTTPDGRQKWNRERVAVRSFTSAGRAIDRLRLACVPAEWPSHGFDRRNSRARPQDSGVTAENVGRLEKIWEFDTQAQILFPTPAVRRANVSSTPTVMDGRVFVTSANGFVYAFDARTGTNLWQYKALATQYHNLVPGIYSSVTLTADGRAVFGDGAARVHVLDQRTGDRLWRVSVGNPVLDHIWASPVVSNGRIYVGVASHFDTPCVRGRVVALDLEDGSEIWTRYMVPENVCDNDPDRECTTHADCGAGTCVEAMGAGVTATPALDATGENLFVNTVGCATFPSVGHSDSILKLDAATGEVVWATRLAPREHFGTCSSDPSLECMTDAACPPGDSCEQQKGFRDFGFVNGPLLVDADDGSGGRRTLVVSGAKEGVLWALEPDGGSVVWSNPLFPHPEHGGQGYFSGGLGFADDRFYAAIGGRFVVPDEAPFHQLAASAIDGSAVWTEALGRTYSAVGVADGIVFSGSPPGLVAQEASTGALLASFPLPAPVQSAPTIVDGRLYIGWGSWLNETGGITAFAIR